MRSYLYEFPYKDDFVRIVVKDYVPWFAYDDIAKILHVGKIPVERLGFHIDRILIEPPIAVSRVKHEDESFYAINRPTLLRLMGRCAEIEIVADFDAWLNFYLLPQFEEYTKKLQSSDIDKAFDRHGGQVLNLKLFPLGYQEHKVPYFKEAYVRIVDDVIHEKIEESQPSDDEPEEKQSRVKKFFSSIFS